MILYIPENGSYPNKNDIFSSLQKENIFGASLEPSIRLQYMAGLDI